MHLRRNFKLIAAAAVVLAGNLVGLLWWRKWQKRLKDTRPRQPAEFLIMPRTAAAIKRESHGHLTLTWQYTADKVHIYRRPLNGDETTRQLVAQLENQQQLDLGPAPRENYHLFELEFSDGRTLTTAERILPLTGGFNFRDIGGYETTNGRFTRWGKLYRSGDLSNLTPADLAYLEQLNLRLVCDLRTTEEARRSPNQLPSQAALRYLHHPIYEHERQLSQWLRILLLQKSQIERLWLEEVYIKRFLENNAPAFGRILTLMADANNYPAVFHCTAGKDRTGISFALLLTILGVPEGTIAADYTLSNLYYEQILNLVQADTRRLALVGIQTTDLFPLLTAPAMIIQQALAYLRQQYGSVECYLTEKAAVAPAILQTLRSQLTETPRQM